MDAVVKMNLLLFVFEDCMFIILQFSGALRLESFLVLFLLNVFQGVPPLDWCPDNGNFGNFLHSA